MRSLLVILGLVLFIGFSSACSDKHTSCARWKASGFCTRTHVDYMKLNCAKACGFCTTGGGGSGTCGRSSVQQSRIIAGDDAKPGVTTSNLQIKLGEHNHKVADGNEQVMAIERIISHPSYNRRTLTNDIALIKLKQPVRFNSRVTTICLPAKGSRPAQGSRQCYLAGWGSIQHPGPSHNILQQSMLPVVSYTKCFNRKDMLCTGYGRQSLINACRGDSGGPYVCRKSDGSWEQHGVASFVVEYCKYYTGFTPVSSYIDWINGHINN